MLFMGFVTLWMGGTVVLEFWEKPPRTRIGQATAILLIGFSVALAGTMVFVAYHLLSQSSLPFSS
jgi:hypothetical protein